MADISVVIVNYNTAHLLDECLQSLRLACAGLSAQIIVIDNASRDQSVLALRTRHPDVELILNNVNVGFGRANNQAIERLAAPFVLLLNTDAFVAPDAVRNSRAFMLERPDVGIVGARLTGRDGVLQPSCRYFPTQVNQFALATGFLPWPGSMQRVDDMDWDHESPRECDWVPGCFYMMRRDLISRVGLFDPRYFLYMEEVDHCRAAKRQGWKVVFFPGARVVHIGGESARSDGPVTALGQQVSVLQMESELLYYRKWYGLGGVLQHLALRLLAIALLACKRALRPRAVGDLRAQFDRAAQWLRLASRTAFGAHGIK